MRLGLGPGQSHHVLCLQLLTSFWGCLVETDQLQAPSACTEECGSGWITISYECTYVQWHIYSCQWHEEVRFGMENRYAKWSFNLTHLTLIELKKVKKYRHEVFHSWFSKLNHVTKSKPWWFVFRMLCAQQSWNGMEIHWEVRSAGVGWDLQRSTHKATEGSWAIGETLRDCVKFCLHIPTLSHS